MTSKTSEERAASCPLCGARARHFLRVPHRLGGPRLFDLERCGACELVFVHPIPTEAERTELGDGENCYFEIIDGHRGEFEKEARRLLGLVAELEPPPGALLDVGSGGGLLLSEAASHGWRARGVEVSADACRRAAARGLEVAQGDFLDVDLPRSSFDVVLLQQVIEHSTTPVRLLERAKEVLRPRGLLYVGTPNSSSLLARCRAEKFNYWIPPEHVFHYNRRSLGRLLEQSGFGVARWNTFFCEPPVAHDLAAIRQLHPWLRRLPGRLARLLLEASRGVLERRGEGTILEALARPV